MQRKSMLVEANGQGCFLKKGSAAARGNPVHTWNTFVLVDLRPDYWKDAREAAWLQAK